MIKDSRTQRHKRVRAKVRGTTQRPRVSVYRSTQRLYVQLVDDSTGRTVVSSSSDTKKIESAQKLGKRVAAKAVKNGIQAVVFDRGGYKYHGRIKALAQAMREGGLEF